MRSSCVGQRASLTVKVSGRFSQAIFFITFALFTLTVKGQIQASRPQLLHVLIFCFIPTSPHFGIKSECIYALIYVFFCCCLWGGGRICSRNQSICPWAVMLFRGLDHKFI